MYTEDSDSDDVSLLYEPIKILAFLWLSLGQHDIPVKDFSRELALRYATFVQDGIFIFL